MPDDTSLTHAQLAERSGVSVTTVKSYRSKFPGCFPLRSKGKPLRFAPEAAEACEVIREAYELGLSTEEARERLRLRFPWSYRRPRKDKNPITPDLAKSVQDLAATVARMTQTQNTTLKKLESLEQATAPRSQDNHPQDAPSTEELLALREDVAALRNALEQRTPPEANEMDTLRQEIQHLRSELEALRSDAADTPQAEPRSGSAKVVRVRTPSGQYERYALHRLPPDGPSQDKTETTAAPARRRSTTGPPKTPSGRPGEEFLDLPMTVLSPKGEYLGVASSDGHLTVRDFPAIMTKTLGTGTTTATWTAEPQAWRLDLDADPHHSFTITDTVTPRGNRVALVQTIRIANAAQSPEAMVALLRDLRRSIS